MRAVVVTVSNRVNAGVYADETGAALRALLQEEGFEVGDIIVVPDGVIEVTDALERALGRQPDLIVTNGGTGIHPQDNTPEATREFVWSEVPGIAEAMRAASLDITPMAMLSRGIAGVRDRTLVINLPGSPKAALENLGVVLPVLRHAVDQLRGGDHPR